MKRAAHLALLLFALSFTGCVAPSDAGIEEHLAEEGLRTIAYFPVVERHVLPAQEGPVVYTDDVRRIWKQLIDCLPESTRRGLDQVRGIRVVDGDDAPPGAAGPMHDDPTGDWEILLARYALKGEDKEELFWVLVHEYGHVLSLGDPAITLDEAPHLIPSGPNFGDFYQRYWKATGLADDLREINPEASFDPDIEQRFIAHVRTTQPATDFVSEFAMVSPEEDFTETFAAYVLERVSEGSGPVPGGGAEKLAWFQRAYPKD